MVALFALTTPGFLTEATFRSIAFQLPELGLDPRHAHPDTSGGMQNLAITFTANMAALVAVDAAGRGGPDAGAAVFLAAVLAALAVGAAAGGVMGLIIAYVGAHLILLVSLSMMIFLRGLGSTRPAAAT